MSATDSANSVDIVDFMGSLDSLEVVKSIDDMRFITDVYLMDIMGLVHDVGFVDTVNSMGNVDSVSVKPMIRMVWIRGDCLTGTVQNRSPSSITSSLHKVEMLSRHICI